jgi:hypothetical protein
MPPCDPNLSQPTGNHRSLTSRVASAAGRLRSNGQAGSNPGRPDSRLYFQLADKPRRKPDLPFAPSGELWAYLDYLHFLLKNPLEGYRRLTFMMLDADIVAVSPASVWRVLSRAGLLRKWSRKPSKKGSGFEQPLQPHQHWHIDVS